jgi:peroxiredoxin
MHSLHQMFYHRRITRHGWALLQALLLCSCFSGDDLKPGDKAPSFEVKALDGKPFRFNPPLKKIHIIYFWAAWCRYCEDDFQQLNKLYVKWKKKVDSPHLLVINAGQPEERIRKFIKKMNTSFPIYLDRNIKLAHRFGIHALPTYFITDRQGTIRHIILGWANEEMLLKKIDKIR